MQPAFADCRRGPLPVTEELGKRVLGLPHFPDMQEEDTFTVAGALVDVLRPVRSAPGRKKSCSGVDLYVGGSLGRWAVEFAAPPEVSSVEQSNMATLQSVAGLARKTGFFLQQGMD